MNKTIPFLLITILFAVAAWFFFVKEPEPVHEVLPPQLPPAPPVIDRQPQTEPQPEEIEPYIEPEPQVIPEPLPALIESDEAFTSDLAGLVGSDPLAEYLVKSETISRLVAMVDSLTSRQVSPEINPIKPVEGKFQVEGEDETVRLSAQNFARYDDYVELLQSIDTDTLVAVYHRYQPLFQQAWEDNGGEGTFDGRLLEIIDHLLETPDVPGPIYLSKPEAVYLFVEPELEAMTAGQKILVRMGSVNASVVKEKLQEIKTGLTR